MLQMRRLWVQLWEVDGYNKCIWTNWMFKKVSMRQQSFFSLSHFCYRLKGFSLYCVETAWLFTITSLYWIMLYGIMSIHFYMANVLDKTPAFAIVSSGKIASTKIWVKSQFLHLREKLTYLFANFPWKCKAWKFLITICKRSKMFSVALNCFP